MSEIDTPYDYMPMQARLIRANGTDLDVVNAARRSFGQQSDWEDDPAKWSEWSKDEFGHRRGIQSKDANLLRFLGRGLSSRDFDQFLERMASAGWAVHEEFWRGESDRDEDYNKILADKTAELIRLMWQWRDEPVHDTPFNHVGLHVAIMVPMNIARQLVKHEYMPWSEISRRYKGQNQEPGPDQERLAFWKPGLSDGVMWREAPADRKQGSGGPLPTAVQAAMDMSIMCNVDDAYQRFLWALNSGVCMEQARMLLPPNLMVEVTWSGFLGAFCKMLRERLGLGAQEEARVVARMLYDIAVKEFPISVPSLVRNR